MGNNISIRIKSVPSVDPDFEMTKDADKYIHLHSSNNMIEHLTNKPDYYGLKCKRYNENKLICRYASMTMDPFYNTNITLTLSPERIKEIIYNRKYTLQCAPDIQSEEWMICMPPKEMK